MASPLAGSLARTIGTAMKGLFLDASLTRETQTSGSDPFDPPAPIVTGYPCKAIVQSYSDYYRANNLVQQSDRKVLILHNSLGVRPQEGDRVTISGITFTLQNVSIDPAEAVWECQGRM